ncbi:DUF1800 family protein [Sphingomonas sp. AR_OL41]|uniref:DUF1800 domain-containing protein n=1 Tax=Sphingomonas sp. AR_OL41 TaxID=3042729 RepID=UPI00247FD23D|nr:DUF1800 family protein [Sphingomonas sp. AR_OL41]MDH7971875.1 DUF1800 family protein [Sphingomonas sp. AR_OL41]
MTTDTIPSEQATTSDPVAERGRGSGTSAIAIAAALTPMVALAACSGGGGTSAPSPTPTPAPTSAAITKVQASRFLAQATMGATDAMIADVQTRSFDGWLSAQFALPRATAHWDWLVAQGYSASTYINSETGFDPTMWRQLIVEPDQLRQRVGFALSEIMVVGIAGINLNWRQFAAAAYMDVLLENAFGNFRSLLDAITTNAAMASYLTFLGNRKASSATGAVPDENYARELMQLFTLGLYQLNMDGTDKLSAGNPIETYVQADVSGLARVFTGLSLANSTSTTPDRYRLPLVMNASLNETGSASFLGTSVSGGGMAAIKTALDTIFAHPNVPPFFAKQLIQKLVTSNPSPAYVSRVAAAFADNGSGTRGDMKAVIRAVLLDSEARGDAGLTSTTTGKLREPITRVTGWARAFGATSPSNAWAFGDTSSSSTRLAESPGRSSSVFNFFRPGYSPPNSAISSAGLVAPEFQITNELSVVAYVNYLQTLIANGAGDTKADYAAIATLANDSQALIDQVNLLVAAGQLSAATVSAIKATIDSISFTGTNGPGNRVGTAILLTMASPDYLTLK